MLIPGHTANSYTKTMSNEEYHKDPSAISRSDLSHILQSPAHYKAAKLHHKEETAAQRIGSALHCAVLEPNRFIGEYISYDGSRRGKNYQDFNKANQQKVILTEDEMAKVMGMREAILQFKDFPLGLAFRMGESEKSVFWEDSTTGIQCKCRFDHIDSPIILDLKTTTDARPQFFIKQAYKLDYDLQYAHYSAGGEAFYGEAQNFLFVTVEIDAPHGVWVHRVNPKSEFAQKGRNKRKKALEMYKKCLDTNTWPSYSGAFTDIGKPLMMERQF